MVCMTDYTSLIEAINDDATREAVMAVWLGGREVGRALQDAEAEIETLKATVANLQQSMAILTTSRG
jgi:hypothetical protein